MCVSRTPDILEGCGDFPINPLDDVKDHLIKSPDRVICSDFSLFVIPSLSYAVPLFHLCHSTVLFALSSHQLLPKMTMDASWLIRLFLFGLNILA